MHRVRESSQLNVYRVSLLVIVLAMGAFSIAGCGDDGGGAAPPSQQPGAIILPPLAQGGLLNPNAISADGSTVVGYGGNANGKLEAFRWTSKEGTVALGFLPGYTDGSNAASVSGDGSKIVGISIDETSQSGSAWFWTKAGGMQPIPMPVEVLGSNAIQVTADGKYVLGAYTDTGQEMYAFIWSGQGTSQTVTGSESNPPDQFAPVAITEDGLRVFFNRETTDTPPTVKQGGVVHQYGLPFGGGEWGGYNLTPEDSVDTFFVDNGAISSDGGTVAGYIQREDHFVTPGIWLAQGSLLEIAPGVIGRTKCVSPDGSMAGGGNGDEGAAFIWDIQVGFQNLMLHLRALDQQLGTQYLHTFATTGTPADVTGIAANNKRLVGTAGQVATSNYWAAFLLDLP
jgi:hypothetical protein